MTWNVLNVATLNTDLSKSELQAHAQTLGLGKDNPTTFPCDIFKDQIHSHMMRHIGYIHYSPEYVAKRGGPWRIKYFTDVTPSDELVLLHVACSFMQAGPSTTYDWIKRPFSDPELGTFLRQGVCRPLSDYSDDELFTMIMLPETLPLQHLETKPLCEVSQ